ncbi:hypothetical protein EC80586_3948, partial [Escherichia coli 8.0586]
MPPENHQFG